jgi:hypothetical protein
MTPFVLNHLLAVSLVSVWLLSIVVMLALCRAAALPTPNGDWPHGPPLIRLDWVGPIPVAVIESDPATAADVAAWLEAVRTEGMVLRV